MTYTVYPWSSIIYSNSVPITYSQIMKGFKHGVYISLFSFHYNFVFKNLISLLVYMYVYVCMYTYVYMYICIILYMYISILSVVQFINYTLPFSVW